MFSIYGLSGPVFHGTLEDLGRIPQVTRRQPVRAIARVGEDFGTQLSAVTLPGVQTGIAREQAIKAYQDSLQVDQERGPLYHAEQIMQRDVIVLATSDSVEHAWRVLIEHDIHQAPVLDAGRRLVGIVSERDLLTTFNVEHGRVRDVLARSVSDVMSTPVVSADPLTDIRRIADVMLTRGVDGVPIVNDSAALVGFISRSDVLRAVVTDPPLSLWR
jgi:CBS-domain-containing membrane protein